MKNLFDTVPDKVLIYTRMREALVAPKSLYSNRQMNEFFGSDVVNMDRLFRNSSSGKEGATPLKDLE